jgi:predicted dienelactone hydrolase
MYPLEILLVLALTAQLITQNLRRVDRRASLGASIIALAAIALSIALGQARWQMAPAYLLAAALALLWFLRKSFSHVAVRCIGAGAGFLLVALSVLLSLALPIVKLRAPEGPYVVGFRSFSLVDETRTGAYFGLPREHRELSIQAWYPGVIDSAQPEPRVRRLWEELYRGPSDPVVLLTGYLRGVKTHSHLNIPLGSSTASYPVILFSHALALNAEQNTMLMEHLASHGYIVVGISHTHMSTRVTLQDGRVVPVHREKLREAFAEAASLNEAEFEERYKVANDDAERAALQIALGERFPRMNEQLAIRVGDLQFVMDVIAGETGNARDRAGLLARADPDRMGLLGMSVGGAAVAETCKIDTRCRAGLNLDGGLFGTHQREPLKRPFLSLISPANEKFNGYLRLASQNDYYEVRVDGAAHGDFFDMTFLMPFMKWIGANGPIAPERAVEVVNAVALSFFDAYLRNGSSPHFDRQRFPELHVTTSH